MDDLVKCYRCTAQYRPGGWGYGRYAPGTTGKFYCRGEIPYEHCPICRKPPLLEKPVEYHGAM